VSQIKNNFLLVAGVILVIFGVVGFVSVGIAYSNVKPLIDDFLIRSERVLSFAEQNIVDGSTVLNDGADMLLEMADNIDYSLSFWQQFEGFDEDLRALASKMDALGDDFDFYEDQVDELKNEFQSRVGFIRLSINGAFIFLVIQYATFTIIGTSLLLIRQEMVSINSLIHPESEKDDEPKIMVRCFNCNELNPEEAEFCMKCAQKLKFDV
jgi:hypothetical protein